MSPLAAFAETLTQAELADQRDRILAAGWKPLHVLPEPHVSVYLVLAGNVVVRGWLATHLRCAPRTWWTWDRRFIWELADRRRVPACVEPVAWCECEVMGLMPGEMLEVMPETVPA